MLTRIVQPSPALESFLDSLHLPLSQPQRDHLLHLVDGSLVCEERKTLAALQRQFLDSTDPSNWADFLRISPWFAEDVRCAIRRHQVAWLVAEVQRRSVPKVLYVNLDDSLGKKDKRTSPLEPVDWFHDHNESTPRHPRYYKAFCYLECTLHAEDLTATADLRLYLRDKTVRRLNRHRSPKGNDLVRGYLWNAAWAAIRWNPAIRALYRRLRAKGKRGDVAFGHCMRKLVHLVYAVWKTDRPFDEKHFPWEGSSDTSLSTTTPLAADADATPSANENAVGHKQDLPAEAVVTTAASTVEPASCRQASAPRHSCHASRGVPGTDAVPGTSELGMVSPELPELPRVSSSMAWSSSISGLLN